jgi:hypothetical protein
VDAGKPPFRRVGAGVVAARSIEEEAEARTDHPLAVGVRVE